MDNFKSLEILEESTFQATLKLIYELTGITIAKSRKSMVQGRIRKRTMALGLGSYEDYINRVKSDPTERPIFIDLITTNETYFYRTPRIWEYIAETLLPIWITTHPNETFQAWSAAASSGEEAHTLALILQAFKSKHPAFCPAFLLPVLLTQIFKRCFMHKISFKL